MLRQALAFLDTDRSFDLAAPDDTFKQFDAKVGPAIDLLLTGHTHLARSLPRTRGPGHYFNSGTWARLLRIAPELRQDPVAFAKLYARLGGGPLADLETPVGPVLRRNTVVAIWVDAAGGAQAELRQVQTDGHAGWRAAPQDGTRYAKPKA